MTQPPSSMTAEPRRHKCTCWTPHWEYIKMIIRPKANPEDLGFGCAGSPGSTACDPTVLRTPTASLDLDTKDNRSTTQEISSILPLEAKTRELWDKYEESARRKSTHRRYPEDASEEDNTFSANEPACDSHPLPCSKELKAFPNVTTNCGLGLTKCNQVTSLQDSNAEADKYRSTAL
jgi:hypothetical protein